MILRWGKEKRKKYRIYAHKLYSAKDVSRRIEVEEKKIIALLEEKKNIGRKMGNFWLIRGSEILKIKKLLSSLKEESNVEAETGSKMVGRTDGKRIKKK